MVLQGTSLIETWKLWDEISTEQEMITNISAKLHTCERWITAAIHSSEGTDSAEERNLSLHKTWINILHIIYYYIVLVWVLLVTLALVFKITSSSVTQHFFLHHDEKLFRNFVICSKAKVQCILGRRTAARKHLKSHWELWLLFCLVLELRDPMWRDMQRHSTPTDREAHGPCRNSHLSAHVRWSSLQNTRSRGRGWIQIQLLPPYIYLNLPVSTPWSLNPPIPTPKLTHLHP